MNLIIEGVIFIPQFQKSPKFRRKAPLAPGKQDFGCKVCICDGAGLYLWERFSMEAGRRAMPRPFSAIVIAVRASSQVR